MSPADRPPDLKPFIHALEAAGVTPLQRNATPNQLQNLVRSMRNHIGSVVLAGGDRMLAAAANALRETGLPVGILPLGSDDALARRLGIPSDPTRAAAIILDGYTRSFDLALVNGQPFFGVATVGLTVDDARRLGRAAHHPMARLAFAAHAARLTIRSGRFAAIIRCGSAIHRVRTVQITIGNGHSYVGRMEPGMEQPGQDGSLQLYSLEPVSKRQFTLSRHAFRATAAETVPEARRAHGTVIEIVTRLPRPITADGAVIAITPARFTILPRAIDVFVPAPAPSP